MRRCGSDTVSHTPQRRRHQGCRRCWRSGGVGGTRRRRRYLGQSRSKEKGRGRTVYYSRPLWCTVWDEKRDLGDESVGARLPASVAVVVETGEGKSLQRKCDQSVRCLKWSEPNVRKRNLSRGVVTFGFKQVLSEEKGGWVKWVTGRTMREESFGPSEMNNTKRVKDRS